MIRHLRELVACEGVDGIVCISLGLDGLDVGSRVHQALIFGGCHDKAAQHLAFRIEVVTRRGRWLGVLAHEIVIG